MPWPMRALYRYRLHPHARAAALACFVATQAGAQIATDASLGQAARSLSGPAYSIPQSLGRLAGSNLFHSFQTFNIGSGESATFTTAAPGIANVISRVTGGDPSLINGRLRLLAASGTPGFFFINPAGVTFGAGAAVDVPGAFHLGAADYVAFPDGRFNADPTIASSFSSAAPQAFGFLGSRRAAIELRDGAELVVPRGLAIVLAAGDITLDNSTIGAGGGSIRLDAVGSQPGEVIFVGSNAAAAGKLLMTRGATIFSASREGIDGGEIALNAGRIEGSAEASVISRVGDGISGNGGSIDIRARDALVLTGGAHVTSDTGGSGNGGAVRVFAGDVLIDSNAYLYSSSSPSASGRSGAIDLTAHRGLRITGAGNISTFTGGSGDGGGVRLQAASMQLDGRAYVQIDAASGAAPGGLVVDVAGQLALAERSRMVTGTSAAGHAGAVDLRAGRLAIASDAFVGSLALPGSSGSSGLVDLKVSGDASLGSGASLLSSSSSSGDASPVRLSAVNLLLDNASINSNSIDLAGGASGHVELLLSGDLTMDNRSGIDTSTLSKGAAGTISVRARNIVIDRDSRISSSALDGSGSAGALELRATGNLTLQRESSLSTSTSTTGNAGAIVVSASEVLLESGARVNSLAGIGSSGNGGNITITASRDLLLRSAATIGANTTGRGQAGSVRLDAANVTLDGKAFVSTSTTAASTGNAGRIDVVTPGKLRLRNGAFISSDTQGAGNAGLVDIRAGSVTMDSAGRISSGAGRSSSGDAGRIDLLVGGDLEMLDSSGAVDQAPQISTSTFASGKGGEISVRAANVLIDAIGGGVVSFAITGSSGQAGSITLQASRDLVIRAGGLSTSTDAAGAAGRIDVSASRVVIDGPNAGVTARAGAASAGQAGSIILGASESIALGDGAFATIDNDASVANPASRQPTRLGLVAPEISLRNLAFVSAESTGNVAASDIDVAASRSLLLNRSTISTSANAGNGGAITVSTGGLATLRNSVIRTSVFGPQGNGGNIDLRAGMLLLDSGFVQANTAARDAAGGLVRITAGALLTSGSSLFLGGNTAFVPTADVFGFNVIQAAAPTGISGDVQLANPALDVTGSLRELRAEAVDAGGLGRSLCQNTGGSALALSGRGGLASGAAGLLRADGRTTSAGPVVMMGPRSDRPVEVAGRSMLLGGCP